MAHLLPMVRDISSTNWDGAAVRTDQPLSFALAVEIGDAAARGADLFYVSICNTAFLSDAALEGNWIWRDCMLVLATLSFENVRLAVEHTIRDLGPFATWPEFAAKMAPFMRW